MSKRLECVGEQLYTRWYGGFFSRCSLRRLYEHENTVPTSGAVFFYEFHLCSIINYQLLGTEIFSGLKEGNQSLRYSFYYVENERSCVATFIILVVYYP